MKKISSIIIAAFLSCISFAQQRVSPGFVCSYYGEPVSLPLTVVNSSEAAKHAIDAIMDVVGLEGNFEVKQANIPNAAAIIYNSKRFILYNPDFINKINNAAGDKWAAIAILAHEIGHHLDGHTLSSSGSHPETEFQADEFSGFVLRKMGASLEQAQSAMNLLASERATDTHPAKPDRLVSIDNGWTKAEDQMTGKKFIAKAIPSSVRSEAPTGALTASKVEYTLDPAVVNFKVFFTADENGKYFITTQNNFVTLRNGAVVVLGKLILLRGENYPFALKINDKEYFLVSKEGLVLTKEGKTVGYLKA